MATADVVAIREAIKALVGEVIPQGLIVFGGHPAITPLIALLLRGLGAEARHRLILYQSAFFAGQFVQENDEFIDLRVIPAVLNSQRSIEAMRIRMIEDTAFDVGVFIGGMEGVLEEFNLFRDRHPRARLWPIASTGAAAKELFEMNDSPRPDLFLEEMTYPTLFRQLLAEMH
jgi:SLOG cluster3 family